MKEDELAEILRQVAYRCTKSRLRPDQREREFFLAGMFAAAELSVPKGLTLQNVIRTVAKNLEFG